MLTGLYPHKHGMLVNDGVSGVTSDFSTGYRLIGQALAEAGYANGYFGKWHCGLETLPADFGFNGWSQLRYGRPYQSQTYSRYLKKLGLPRPRVIIDWDLLNPDNEGREFDLVETGWGPFTAAGHLLSPLETHEAQFVAHLAGEWLRQQVGVDRPFFLRVDTWGPHHPYHSAGRFIDSISPDAIPQAPSYERDYDGLPLTFESCRRRWNDGEEQRGWAFWRTGLARCYEQAMVVDDAFGQVLTILEELGLRESTLVIMTADHGDLIAAHGDLFNKDCLMVEETMRVPLTISWPERISAGQSCSRLVSNMDLAPTVLEAAGIASEKMDGDSLLSLATGPAATWREELMCQHHGGFRVEFFQRMLRWKNYKYVAHLDDIDELYDLAQDPHELDNLIGQKNYRTVMRQMQLRLAQQMAHFTDDSPDAQRLLAQMGRWSAM